MLVVRLSPKKETTARAGDPCNAAQHCRCHPVGLQQKIAATHAVNHIGPHPESTNVNLMVWSPTRVTSESRLAFGKCAPDLHLARRETPRAHSDTAGETAERHHGHTATQQERGQTDTATQHFPDQSGLHPYNRTGLEPNRIRNPGPVSKLQLKPLIYIYEIKKANFL